MKDSAQQLIKTHLDDAHLLIFGDRLTEWLIADLNQGDESAPEFTESRAKALLRAADVIDAPTMRSFVRLMGSEYNDSENLNKTAVRVAIFDLLKGSELAENEEVVGLAITSAAVEIIASLPSVSWLSLTIATFAWKNGYPLHQLDPASPPEVHSPAGQLIKRAAHFMRQQVQRSATERDKLARKLLYVPEDTGSGVPSLDEMHQQETTAPLPPHYRPPIPVSYPEMDRETIHLDEGEPAEDITQIPRTDPITITDNDLPVVESPQRMPSIRITSEQVQPQTPTQSRVVTPGASPPPLTSFSRAVRQKFGRDRESFTTTKLRIIIQEFPDGPGLYGLQVRVTCQGVRSFVAGTTNRSGQFLCELPVRIRSGLTYDIDVTWPRDLGGDTERKSITLNGDRREFALPFYRRFRKDEG